MRRIAALLLFVALVAGLTACTADAPTPTGPTGNGGGSHALQISLFTNNANPTAGLCSTLQAVVTLNGVSVPDGTGVSFSTDFGFFQQNQQPLVSVVTQGGTAVTAICSTAAGVAKVHASVGAGNLTASTSISISFQPSTQAVPFFSFCSPNFGPNTGGTVLTISGGRFFGTASSTRVQFTSMGVTREGVVQSVTESTVSVLTPAFPEAISPTVPVDITITFGTNTGAPVTISAPGCFVYGSAAGDQPTITAVLPSTGGNDGGTRVTIIGSGFKAPVQVFFGNVEAPPPTSVTYNQITVLSPAATGPGLPNRNANVSIRVRNATSGKEGVLAGSFTYVGALQLTAVSAPNLQRVDSGFVPITIFGNGFSSPMAVTLAGFGATIVSVSATQLVVVPGNIVVSACTDVTGPIVVTNVNNGDTATGLSFTYLVALTAPQISSVTYTPPGQVGSTVTITGFNFPPLGSVQVLFGTRTAAVISSTPTSITVIAPDDGKTAPTCAPPQVPGDFVTVDTASVVVTNLFTKCTVTAVGAFIYQLPCQ